MVKDKELAGGGGQYRLRAGQRLKRKVDFEQVFARGRRVEDRRLAIHACANECGHARVGLGVGKRLGGAVKRSRYKRLLREAFRLCQDKLPVGYDYVLIPQSSEAPSLRLYEESLVRLGRKLQCRQEQKGAEQEE